MALRRRNRQPAEEPSVDMVPIMNMFLVLIPFMLLSASFFHVRAINTSVPVLSSQAEEAKTADEFKKKVKIIVTVEIKEDSFYLYGVSSEVDQKEMVGMEKTIAKIGNEYPLTKFVEHLQKIKEKYPMSDTLIVIPREKIVYDIIIKTMDAARYADKKALFPKVVLSGKV